MDVTVSMYNVKIIKYIIILNTKYGD